MSQFHQYHASFALSTSVRSHAIKHASEIRNISIVCTQSCGASWHECRLQTVYFYKRSLHTSMHNWDSRIALLPPFPTLYEQFVCLLNVHLNLQSKSARGQLL